MVPFSMKVSMRMVFGNKVIYWHSYYRHSYYYYYYPGKMFSPSGNLLYEGRFEGGPYNYNGIKTFIITIIITITIIIIFIIITITIIIIIIIIIIITIVIIMMIIIIFTHC